ncbi:hypothetical protein EVAR_69517_1, partial [Eumeta japonica]
ILTFLTDIVCRSCKSLRLADINLRLQKVLQNKVCSGQIGRPGNVYFSISVVARAVCAIAPSYWNHIFSNPNSSSYGKKNSLIIALKRSPFTVTIWPETSSKQQYSPQSSYSRVCHAWQYLVLCQALRGEGLSFVVFHQ